jgi:hypothetical protein
MAIQISNAQIQDGVIAYGKFLSSDIETTLTGGSNKLASASAIKAYVDAQVPDSFSGGNGIDIDASGDPDVISVDLATNPGLQFTLGKLDIKVKAESGGAITKDADGLYIADNAIANAKLQNDSISGKALGTNLDALSAGNGLAGTNYDGSAAQSFAVQADGSTLAVGANGVKVSDGGIDTLQLADDAVESTKLANGAVATSAKMADDIVSPAKLTFGSRQDVFSPDGATAAFALASEVDDIMANMVMVFKNGLLAKKVASSPADADEYTVTTSAGTTTVTFGANISSADSLEVRYFA